MKEEISREHRTPESEQSEKITLKDALREGGLGGVIFKPEDSSVKEMGLSSEQEEAMLKLGIRHRGHMERMLQPERSDTENQFATDFLDNYSAVIKKLEDIDEDSFEDEDAADEYAEMVYHLEKLLREDVVDTQMWWTFAPYLVKELKAQGIETAEALERTLLWAKAAVKGEQYIEEPNVVHHAGLEDFTQPGETKSKTYVLGANPEAATHKFTQQRAQEIIKRGLI